MDIGHNLFYNENTVHSGNFLENRTGFGKETMRKTMNKITVVLLLMIMLCGCTRREQLVLEGVSKKQEQEFDRQIPQEQSESGLQAAQDEPTEQSIPEDGEGPQTIFVHVCGAVENPDVYELPAGSRVYEAVQAAGGFTQEADSSYVNQAQKLTDGLKLVIPTLEQTEAIILDDEGQTLIGIVEERDGSGGQDAASDGKININTASEAELCNIPGIGAVRAAAIAAYRQEMGGFSSIEDIKNVSGIKEGTYEKIKDFIKIN